MPHLIDRLPEVRGKYFKDRALAPYTWFRVGGPAEVLFIPADEADLALFLSATPDDIPVMVMGVASNMLVRDGGVPGVVVRLGPAFGKIEQTGDLEITAGTAALDARVAKFAAGAGIAGLEFYAGIPGTIGGALRMNAGCYESETKDVLVEAVALDRRGRRQVMPLEELGYTYRHSAAPDDLIFTQARFRGRKDAPAAIKARMDDITARREASQPIREKTGGSTFKNPDPAKSGGLKSWQLIDEAGCRGLTVGGAQMSEKHCNFMINTGDATAADLENLGKKVQFSVSRLRDVNLEWEIKRVGKP